jgi:hypothetical protein
MRLDGGEFGVPERLGDDLAQREVPPLQPWGQVRGTGDAAGSTAGGRISRRIAGPHPQAADLSPASHPIVTGLRTITYSPSH